MLHVALIGSGKIGEAIVTLFNEIGGYKFTVVDKDMTRLQPMVTLGAAIHVADVANDNLETALKGVNVILSACPFYLTPVLAKLARNLNAHYFDLTEDVASTRIVKDIARDATTVFMPQCGLAPGFISVAGYELAKKFDTLRDVNMRVGALPIYPTNALKYNLTWSTDGLINEYLNPCEAIIDGKLRETPPMEELEHFSLDGLDYEAFNTSGGLGTLCETLEGKVQNLNYKTVRYPGHCEIMKILLNDLGLGKRRELLKDVMETAIPMTYQDVVLVFVSVSGQREGRLAQESFAKKIYAKKVGGKLLSAIQLTTASGICTMVDLLAKGELKGRGFVRQESVSLPQFLANPFGAFYA
ncbi:MAG: saccharopine dehydrogenase NADP-binding domain-containing protein [Rhodocyclaceae bacterium]|nr:saccharopine dehydrogenase NADP-binding domain-containing protein [Rhodocyclaceae bacterium]